MSRDPRAVETTGSRLAVEISTLKDVYVESRDSTAALIDNARRIGEVSCEVDA